MTIWGFGPRPSLRNGETPMKRLISLLALAVALGCPGAQAQYTDGAIKIGVMNDMSGTYADLGGQGSVVAARMRSEEHTSELQSLRHLVCRLLLELSSPEIYTLSLHDALPI